MMDILGLSIFGTVEIIIVQKETKVHSSSNNNSIGEIKERGIILIDKLYGISCCDGDE